MNSAIEILEDQLRQNAKICASSKVLHAFPPILYQPYQTSGIGFIVCMKGKFSFDIENKQYVCKAGQTVFLPHDLPFQVLNNSEDMEVMLLIYQIDSIRDNLGTTVTSINIYSKIYPHRYHVFSTGEEQDLIRYIQQIHASLQGSQNSFHQYEQKLLLLSVTYRLCSIFQQKMLKTNSVNVRQTEIFLHLIELIETCYERHHGVEFYAEKLCLTPKYLSGLSKDLCGYTVQELVFKAIIRKSKTLLDTTNLTIQEISDFFHFSNASNFGTFFKKQTGMSPQRYRMSES